MCLSRFLCTPTLTFADSHPTFTGNRLDPEFQESTPTYHEEKLDDATHSGGGWKQGATAAGVGTGAAAASQTYVPTVSDFSNFADVSLELMSRILAAMQHLPAERAPLPWQVMKRAGANLALRAHKAGLLSTISNEIWSTENRPSTADP